MEDEAKAEVVRAFQAGTDSETIIAVALVSIAISQKRQADRMDRLEKQPTLAARLTANVLG